MAGRKARRTAGRTSSRRLIANGSVKAFDTVHDIPDQAWMEARYAEGYRLYVLHSTEWPPSTAPWWRTELQLGWALAAGLKIAAYVRDPDNWAAGIDACGPYASQLQFFAIDIETDPGKPATRAMVDGIKARGVRPVMYSGSGMWGPIMGSAANDFADVPLWDTNANPSVDPATWTANINSPTPVAYGGWNTPGNPRVMVQQRFETTVGGILVDLNSVQSSFLRDPVASMPTGAYVDATTGVTWSELWEEDFNTAVPSGTAWKAVAGVGLPVGNPYRDKIFCYEPFTDTHGSCWYYSEKTTYTAGSALHIYCHVDTIPETGVPTPLSGTFIPKLGPNYYSQFIRAQWRFRANNADSFWGGVWQIINSEQWPGWGEFDFPEGSLDSQAEGYLHYASSTPNQTLFQPDITMMLSDWHTYTMQWEPSGVGSNHRLQVWFDSEQILDESSGIGTGTMPKVFMFQSGTTSPWNPVSSFPSGNTCDIEIDWVKVWKHPSGTA